MRQDWLDLTKGIAILLVIIGHVFRGYTAAGLFPEYQPGFAYIDYTIYSFHMPLFFLLSGYLYRQREAVTQWTGYGDFALKKLYRLGIPYLVFSLLHGSLRLLTTGHTSYDLPPQALLNILVQPIDYFWFLYVILFIFLCVPILDLSIRSKPLILVVLVALRFCAPGIAPFWPALGQVAEYALYFYLGSSLVQTTDTVFKTPVLTGGVITFLAANCLFWFHPVRDNLLFQELSGLLLALSGSLSCLALVQFVVCQNTWARALILPLGLCSFELYLFHSDIGAAARIFLLKLLHVSHIVPLFIASMVLGISLPLGLAWLARHNAFFHALIYPGTLLKPQQRRTYVTQGT